MKEKKREKVTKKRQNKKEKENNARWCLVTLAEQGTRDDFDEFGGNLGLTGTIVFHSEHGENIGSGLGGVTHSVHTSGNFDSQSFLHSVEETDGKTVFVEIAESISIATAFDFELRAEGAGEGTLDLGERGDDFFLGFVDEEIAEPVVDNDVLVSGLLEDFVSEDGGETEVEELDLGGFVDTDGEGGTEQSGESVLALDTDGEDVEGGVLGLEFPAQVTGTTSDVGVGSTAQTTISGERDEEDVFLVFTFLLLVFHGGPEFRDTLLERADGVETDLGLTDSGGSDELHGLRNLTNTIDRLHTIT